MNLTETMLVLFLAGFATTVALGVVAVPPAILHSSVAQAFLLVMTLVLFAYSPVVGIASIALFAILMFKRNVQKTTQYSQVVAQYTHDSAEQQKYQRSVQTTQPRKYVHFKEDPVGMTKPYAAPEEVGSYPLETPRPETESNHTFTAVYRPAEDMGDNTFVRSETALEDYKMASFAY
jgi:hypothetical protein